MSEILSQEQIDSLLNQKDMGMAGMLAGGSGGGPLEPAAKDYDSLRKAFEIFNEQAGGTISTILNKNAVFETSLCDKTDASLVSDNLVAPLLLLEIPFRAGFEGSLWCIISQKDAAHYSDLMMMGDGTATYTDDHRDAVTELFSQMLGAYSTALGGKIGQQVSMDRITASPFDAGNPPIRFDATDMVVVQGTIGDIDHWRMHFIVPDELGAQITRSLGKGLGAGDMGSGDQAASWSGGDDAGSGASGDSFVETSLSGDSVRTSASHENIDMLLDVELDVYIELGRTNLSIKRILDLSPGSIVELDRMAGEPVDLLVNEKVIAKGEVVVLDENFGIRIVSLVSAEDRIKSLK
jgi:flagellar motor switch protein FliN